MIPPKSKTPRPAEPNEANRNHEEDSYPAGTSKTQVDAQVRAIGCLMRNPSAVLGLNENLGLTARHFPDRASGELWGAIIARAEKGLPTDVLSLENDFFGLGTHDPAKSDAMQILTHAGMDRANSPESFEEHARRIMAAGTVAPSTGRPEQEGGQRESRLPLESFLVDHSATIGMTWEQIEALRPPVIIEGFLRQGEVLVLGAESKSRKSWLAQDAGLSVALGTPWLSLEGEDDQTGFQTKQATVHVLDLELADSEVRYRFAKMRANRLAGDMEGQRKASENFKSYSLEGESALAILAYLDDLAAEVQPGDLVIVDCLYRLQPDGNETEEVARVFENLKRFAKRTKAGIILVDHFRKAGAEKARDRLAGSFVKQASASTIVAIETKGEDILAMSIDARTFHGVKQVHARFNLESYRFQQIPEEDVRAEKEAKAKGEQEARLVQIWKAKSLDALATVADAKDKWSLQKQISRQGASDRLDALQGAGFLEIVENRTGKAKTWRLSPAGREAVGRNLNLHPSLHHEPKA